MMTWPELALSCSRLVSCPINKILYIPFLVERKQCGMILKDNIEPFKDEIDTFIVSETEVTFKDSIVSPEDRTLAINKFFSKLRDKNIFQYTLKGNNINYYV